MNRLKRKFKSFIRLSVRRKKLFFITALLSFYTFLLMRFFNKQAHFRRNKMLLADKTYDASIVRDIRWAIFTVNKYAFWENVCRHQAYQAMLLCGHYKQPYEIFIAFKKNKETGTIEGHAWTKVNGEFVTGFCDPEEYIIQTVY